MLNKEYGYYSYILRKNNISLNSDKEQRINHMLKLILGWAKLGKPHMIETIIAKKDLWLKN